MAEKVNKFAKVVEESEACQTKLDGEATLAGFASCKAPELRAYIHAREFTSMDGPSKKEDWKWPNKGKLEDAERGADNLIKRAFDCKDKPVILCRPSPPPAPEATPRHKNALVVTASPQQTTFSNDNKASDFLKNDSWLLAVEQALNSRGHSNTLPVDDKLLERADLLQSKLEK